MFTYLWSKRLSTLVLLLAQFCLLQAQSLSPLARLVAETHRGAATETLFEASAIPDEEALRTAPAAQFLILDETILFDLLATRPQSLTLLLPWHTETLTLDLVKTEVVTPDFKVATSRTETFGASTAPGVHYRGVLRNDSRSLVAISLFDTDIMGMISTDRLGDLVLGRLENTGNRSRYILYADQDLTADNPFACATEETPVQLTEGPQLSNVSGCVRVYFEADYALFQNKGSVQNALNYLSGVFNQVATLYANESVSTKLSQVFVWVTPDFYSKTSSSQALTQFRSFRSSFDADLAHLVGIGGNNLGGIAYVNTLCMPSFAFAYSDINTSYNNVPTFSWTVEVLTHEMGHNLGSNHTHWCGWSGGALDNCYSPEGTCAPGPQPSNGGTIMSYCHLSSTGINFNNGFGTQPGNLIRNKVGAAACLAAACTTSNGCNPPGAITVSNISGNSASISWENVSGASGYSLQWRVVGGSGWNTVSNAFSPHSLNNLPGNDEIEVRLQSVCGLNNSGYSNGIIFLTGASACNPPGNLTVSPATTSAIVSWSAVAGISSYNISWKTENSSSWSTPVNLTGTSYTISYLNTATTYNVRVQSVCGNITSGYTTSTFSTGTNSACSVPTGLASSNLQANSVVVSWNASSGAVYYELQIRKSTSSTWTSFTNIPVTAVQITNLQPGTSYRVRVRSKCSGANNFSNWTPNIVFTTPSGLIPPDNDELVLHFGAETLERTSFGSLVDFDSWNLQTSPNPTSGKLTLQVDGAREGLLTVVLYDLYGKMLLQQTMRPENPQEEMDLSSLPPGMYLLRARDAGGLQKTVKIIRQ